MTFKKRSLAALMILGVSTISYATKDEPCCPGPCCPVPISKTAFNLNNLQSKFENNLNLSTDYAQILHLQEEVLKTKSL